MRQYIPVRNSTPYQSFTTSLGDNVVTIRLRWLNNFSYYAVDILQDGDAVTLGRGLNPQMDILRGLSLGWGKLYLSGEQPTLTNLGVRNRLVYES